MIVFRDKTAAELGLDLIVHTNAEGLEQGVNPFDYGSRIYTDVMKTQALKQALASGRFDGVFGEARRDEEKSRAKERVFSFRVAGRASTLPGNPVSALALGRSVRTVRPSLTGRRPLAGPKATDLSSS